MKTLNDTPRMEVWNTCILLEKHRDPHGNQTGLEE